MKLFLNFGLLIILASCSSNPLSFNEKLSGHQSLASLSEFDSYKISKDEFKLDLLFIKDISNMNKKEISYPDNTQKINVSGEEYFLKYINIAKDKFKNDLIILNGGNFLDGSFQRNRYNVSLLNKIKPDFNAITFNDFESKPLTYIALKLRQVKGENVLSNLVDLSELKSFEIENTKSSKIITKDNVKIGVINIIDPKLIPEKTPRNLKGIIIEELFNSLLKYSIVARNNGAQIVIAHLNTNTTCASFVSNKLNLPVEKVNFDPNQNPCIEQFELNQMIEMLPKKSVDVILVNSKDPNEKINNFINNTLVLSHFSDGSYISFAELIFNKKDFLINKKDSQIFSAIRTCHSFNKYTNDCYTNDKANEKVELVPAKFLGTELTTK